jgi:dTDP-4-dehydrorhamnose reductase
VAGPFAPGASTRWLVTGAGGMLGHDVVAALADRPVTGLTRAELDITDGAACAAAVAEYVGIGGIVVNTAAYTAVDAAEADEAAAFGVNAAGPAVLAAACSRLGARLVHISTDYVVAGDDTEPADEAAALAPRSAYGRTKAAGEWAVAAALPRASWIVRTSWLYGAHGPNFARTMLRLERERDTVSVVDDQRGQPTWTGEVAAAVLRLVDADAPPGVWHATAAGSTTWFGFARRLFALVGADPDRVLPTTTEAFPRPAPRPANSVLGHRRWAWEALAAPADWDEVLTARLGGLVDAWGR